MDNSGDASKNDTSQQQQPQYHQPTTTSIVSSMTTATPITSEIISDLEPDPKFEMTPLERASYDCQEIYGNDSLIDQQDEQSLVDKVIDNIVELGGSHQFPQSLGHTEDKEKMLESIHREITSERSSIDLIADVASRQQSIEIGPMNTPIVQHKEEPSSSSAQGQQRPDLIKTDKVPNMTENYAIVEEHEAVRQTTLQENPASTEPRTNHDSDATEIKDDHSQVENANQNTEQEPIKAAEEQHLEPPSEKIEHQDEETLEEPANEQVNEKAVEQIEEEVRHADEQDEQAEGVKSKVDQHPEVVQGEAVTELSSVQTSDGISDHGAVDSNDMAKQIEDLDQVIVQPLETAEETAPPQSELATEEVEVPVTEEPNESPPKEPEVEKMEVEEHKSPEPVRRSGRKVKIVEKADMDMSTKRPRRSEKTPAKKNASRIEPEPAKDTGDPVPPEPELKEPTLDNLVSEEKPEAPQSSSADISEPIVEPEATVHPAEPQKEELQKEKLQPDLQDKQEKRAKRETRERLARVLRPRETVKRGHEEEPQTTEPPKIEPPKKQVKKTRGSTSEQQPSYEAPKNTPQIKLPNYRSRQTISSSDPITRLERRLGPATSTLNKSQTDTEKKFICHHCDFATDRLNNLVFHSAKGLCLGKLHLGERLKEDITRQQQNAKAKRKSIR